jgi:hypothetical protein
VQVAGWGAWWSPDADLSGQGGVGLEVISLIHEPELNPCMLKVGVGRARLFLIARCGRPQGAAVQNLDRQISDAVAKYG